MNINTDKIKVIIADDSMEFIEGMRLLFSMEESYEILAVYTNGQQLVNSPLLIEADLIVTDIEMPEMNGIEAAIRINFKHNRLPMIALTMHKDRLFLNDIIGAGFRGFVYKPETAEKLFPVIEKVLENKFAFPGDLPIK